MIKSIKGKVSKRFVSGDVSHLPLQTIARLERRWEMIDLAKEVEELHKPFSNHLEKLKGNRLGQWSMEYSH